MVEHINLPRILFPNPSAIKITASERKNENTHDGGFKRHLKDEKDEEKEIKREKLLNPECDKFANTQEKEKALESDEGQGLETTNATKENGRLRSVDIVV